MDDTVTEQNITKVMHLSILCCPSCKIRIPIIKLEPLKAKINIVIKCKCTSLQEKVMSLDSFMESLEIIKSGYCKPHTKKGERYCFYCLNWLCQECLHVHNSLMFDHKASVFNFELNIICEKHRKGYVSYCQSEGIELCEDCIKSKEHQDHYLINLRESLKKLDHTLLSIDDINSSNAVLLNQSLIEVNTSMKTDPSKTNEAKELKKKLNEAYQVNKDINVKLKELLKAIISIEIIIKPFIDFNLVQLFSIWEINKKDIQLNYDEGIDKACLLLEEYYLSSFALTNKSKSNCLSRIECNDSIYCMVKTSEGQILSGSKDSAITLWAYDPNLYLFKSLAVFKGHTKWVLSLCHIKGRSFASGSYDNSIRLWHIGIPDSTGVLKGHEDPVTCLAKLIDDTSGHLLISGSRDLTIRIWNVKNTSCINIIKDNKASIRCLMPLNEDSFYAGTMESTILLYKIKDIKNPLSLVINYKAGVMCFEQFKEGQYGAGLSNAIIIIFDIKNVIGTMKGHQDGVLCLARLSKDNIISGSKDKTIRIWSSQTLNSLCTLNAHDSFVSGLITSNESQFFSSSYDKSIKLFEFNQLGIEKD